MTNSQRMLRNAAALFMSKPITWALSLVFILLVPRNVGPVEWGEWVIAGSIGAIAVALLDCGLITVILKEVPRQPSETASYLGTVLAARLIMTPLLISAMLIFARFAGYSVHTQIVVGLVALTAAVGSVGRVAAGGLQAMQRMRIIAALDVVNNALVTGAAFWLLKISALGIVSIAAVALFAALAGQAALWVGLSRQVRVRPILDGSLLRHVFIAGLPFWANQLFFMVYVWIDGVILSVMATPAEVGWYGVGAQLIATLGFLPGIVTGVVFPELSRRYHVDRAATAALMGSSFRFLVTVSIPMTVGLALVATPAVTTIYGAWFSPAGPALTILAMTLVPVFIATLGNAFIIAADRQLQWTWVMGAMCIINPLLNLVTIPYAHAQYGNGALGAAVALLATDLITGVAAIVLIPASLRIAIWASGPAILRSLMATAIMAMVVWPLRSEFLPVPVILGAVTFGTSAILLGVFPPENVRAVQMLLVRIASKPVGSFARQPVFDAAEPPYVTTDRDESVLQVGISTQSEEARA